MKVLITNNALSTRTGSELYAMEIAQELKKRGHAVAAFSTEIGELANQMMEMGVEVVGDLASLTWIPDIIHGQHHLETMITLAYFSKVPAIYVCHGWRPWQETPPRHPRILQYLAVDSKTLSLAIEKQNVPAEEIRLIHNFVDLGRFPERSLLPAKPRKALMFSNTAKEDNYLSLVRQACQRTGITLDVIGSLSGQPTDRPEDVLGNYDLIFAVGRSALEALVSGVPVIICGDMGVGPMIASCELAELRDKNFGAAAMHSGPDAEALYREILKYDAGDSAIVTKQLRAMVGINLAVDSLEQYYSDVVEKYKAADINPEDEARSLAVYLKEIAILLKQTYADRHQKNLLLLNAQSAKINPWQDRYRRMRKFLIKA